MLLNRDPRLRRPSRVRCSLLLKPGQFHPGSCRSVRCPDFRATSGIFKSGTCLHLASRLSYACPALAGSRHVIGSSVCVLQRDLYVCVSKPRLISWASKLSNFSCQCKGHGAKSFRPARISFWLEAKSFTPEHFKFESRPKVSCRTFHF